ncbi:MAG: PD-(D/E)XK nuclease domain-containing protein, partial [Hespellia sp.]|nr:PD-(D/E)XK nuclease domain-containing protein [Hespellia sp.]
AIRMEGDDWYVKLTIPNREVSSIYRNQISNWFRDEIQQQDLSVLYDAMLNGRVDIFQQELEKYLQNTISYMDSKEAFYHGFLLGLMANLRKYIVKSNREAGLGRYDICVRSNNVRIPPVVLELKRAKKFKLMSDACEEALAQIEDKKYTEGLEENGYTEVICYGLGFFNKQVQVKMVRKELELD